MLVALWWPNFVVRTHSTVVMSCVLSGPRCRCVFDANVVYVCVFIANRMRMSSRTIAKVYLVGISSKQRSNREYVFISTLLFSLLLFQSCSRSSNHLVDLRSGRWFRPTTASTKIRSRTKMWRLCRLSRRLCCYCYFAHCNWLTF